MRISVRICAIILTLAGIAQFGFAGKKRVPLASMNFLVVRDENDKQQKNGLELKTDAEGKASFDGVPYGKLRIQVLAQGFQTYGEDFDVDKPSLDVTVKMKRPARQYSIYEEHPGEQRKPEDKKPQ